MLTEREKRFVEYWERNRDKEKKLFRQLLVGLPIGMLFVVPVIINFSSGWYKRANMWARGHTEENTLPVVLVAALIILVFVAIFAKRHRWEMNEQAYRELLQRLHNEQEQPSEEGS